MLNSRDGPCQKYVAMVIGLMLHEDLKGTNRQHSGQMGQNIQN